MSWVEVVEKRTRNVKDYIDDVNPRRHRAEMTIHDRHYRDDAGQWQDVDETFHDDTLSGFAHVADHLRHAIHIGATGTRRWMPRRDHPGEFVEFNRLQSFSTTWQNVNLGTATRAGNKISWSTTNFDASMTGNWHRIKLEVILKTAAAKRRLRWGVSLVGLIWDNWTLVSQSDGQVVGTIDKPTAWDANGSRDNPNVTITTTYSGGYVEFGGDLSAAVLPVTIDPTFTDGYGGDVQTYNDTWIASDNVDTNYGTKADGECQEGYSGTYRRWLCKFDYSGLSGVTVNSATLYWYIVFQMWVEDQGIIEAHQILSANSNWTEAGATYNHRVGTTDWAGGHTGCGTSGTDYDATSDGVYQYTGGNPAPIGQALTISLNITRFTNMISANYGYLMRMSNSTYVFGLGSSDHATTSYRPKLVVDYTEGGGGGTVTAGAMSQSQTSAAGSVTFTGPTYNLTAGANSQSQSGIAASLSTITPITAGSDSQSQLSAAAILRGVTPLAAGANAQSQVSASASLTAIYPIVPGANVQSQTSAAVLITFGNVSNLTATANIQAQTNVAAPLTALTPITAAGNAQAQTSTAASLTFYGAVYNLIAGANSQAQNNLAVGISAIYPLIGGVNAQTQISKLAILVLSGLVGHGTRRLYQMDARGIRSAGKRPTYAVNERTTNEVDDGD